MKKAYGDTQIKAVLFDLIADFTESFNVGKNMSSTQIAMLIQQIQQTFYYLNLADMKLFFQKMKLGAYGKFYDRIDEGVILTALGEYDVERTEHFRMKEGAKVFPGTKEFHPDVVSVIKKSISKRVDKLNQSKVEERGKREVSDAELFYKRCLRQFDNLFIRFGVNIGIRAIKINKSVFTIDTFIQRKVNNKINNQK